MTSTAMEPETAPAFPAPIDVIELRPGDEGSWDEFVTTCPSGTFFHLTGWKRVIERALGRRCTYLMARRGDKIVGVFPISHARSRIFGDCLVSLPLTVYGGVCADDEAAYRALLEAGAALADRLRVKYLELRNRVEAFPSTLAGRDLYVTFTQDLTPGPEKLMKALPRDTRYAVRKGIKAGLQWAEDLTLEEFYDLYADSVHRLGTPVFPRSLFDALKAVFPRQVRLFAVRKEGKAVAGVLCFYFRDQVLPYYAGARAEYFRDSPNNFMYWSLIEQSANEGCRQFDFGRSKIGTGSYEFKAAWAMTITPLPYRYHLVTAPEVPHMSPVDAKFQLPVAAWKKMPLAWSKVLGPRIIRWIPSI
jgi:FemAB-related protein (PEP-CTERM system-associated)